MKRTINYLALGFLSISLIFTSCKKDEETTNTTTPPTTTTDTPPALTKTYYIQSKQGGVWNTNQTNSQINNQTTEGFGWENYISLTNNQNVSLTIVMPANSGDHLEADILALQGQTLSFASSSSNPYVRYEWIDYDSADADSQSGSACTITSVVADGCDDGVHKSFKVTGTFNCNVATSTGADQAVTNGKFVIRVTENIW